MTCFKTDILLVGGVYDMSKPEFKNFHFLG